jgi:hypothetical protein
MVLVYPTEKYIEWLQSVDPQYKEDDARAIREGEPTAYLFEALDTGTQEEFDALMERHWRDIAKEEFASWYDSPSEWPKLNTLTDFDQYFEVESVEVVLDAADGPMKKGGVTDKSHINN